MDTNPQLIDQLTGEPVPIVPGTGPNGLNPLQQAIPFFPRGNSTDDVWEFVYSFNGQYSEKSLGSGIEPTMSEQQQFNLTMAKVEIRGKTVVQAIREFSRRPDVQEFIAKNGVTLKGSALQKEFSQLLAAYADQARGVMFNANPNLKTRRDIERAISKAKKRDDVEGVQNLEEQMQELIRRSKKGY